MPERKPETPIQRLRALVDIASEPDEERAKRAWRAYIRHLANDAEGLDSDPSTDVLLMQLREAGTGWPTRVNEIRKMLSTSRKRRAANFRVVNPDDPVEDERQPDVVADLSTTEAGNARATLRNAVMILSRDDRWNGRIRYNEFSGEVELDREPLIDEMITGVSVWMDETYGMPASSRTVHEAANYVARDHSYHPIREYLLGLRWDGRERCRELLVGYFGASAETRDQRLLLGTLSQRWMVSCIARVMKPGCKVDTVLVLHGPQGCGKSTIIRALAGDAWYSDTDIDPQGKDAYGQVQGSWLYEVPEIEKWNSRRDQATIKAFLTSQVDRYRPPFKACIVRQPRQCIFVGTTNSDRFLADPTGSRRYWPVTVAGVDVASIVHDRDQLWAEALHWFRERVPWHLTREEADVLVKSQDRYTEIDPWEDLVDGWLAEHYGLNGFRMGDLLTGIDVNAQGQTSRASNRVGKILRSRGYSMKRVGKKHVRLWRLNTHWEDLSR